MSSIRLILAAVISLSQGISYASEKETKPLAFDAFCPTQMRCVKTSIGTNSSYCSEVEEIKHCPGRPAVSYFSSRPDPAKNQEPLSFINLKISDNLYSQKK